MFIQLYIMEVFTVKLSAEVFNIDPEFVEKRILKFIRARVIDAGFSGVVIGLSGGIDSSVTAALCVNALGSDKVLGLMLPEKDSDPNDSKDAIKLAEQFKIPYEIVNITSIIDACLNTYPKDNVDSLTLVGNVKARVRMVTLYYYANKLRRLVAGSSNKSEILVGYFTKFGDGASDILPIGDLYKTQVRRLAEYLQIPKEIIQKTPTAGLWEGQTDEAEIGVSYDVLDLILYGLEHWMNESEIADDLNLPLGKVNRIVEMWRKSEHKRKFPVIFKLSHRTPSLDWRVPLNY